MSLLAAISMTLACGGDPREAPKAGDASSAASARAIEPCRLATAEQVTTVLPGHDGGSVAHAGGSLLKGIDAYQCSYLNADTDLLTVIVHVAADAERFGAIKKSRSYHSDHRQVPIGDAAWVWGEADNMKVQVEKGLTILDLELTAKGATARTDALVALAREAAGKIP
jgi:hypothetical protein